ncbi:MAG: type II toxin-antitoxin system HicA family toxin [Candidatus Micrarchaeota archaeon]|nr:type II toxin-antitoxin system HicA family toxin [Candidatus Micrarchaeota archaeon]
MPKLPLISGEKLAKTLIKSKGYVVRSRKGSHVNLVHRELPPVTIPLHRELARGLLGSILKLTGLGQDEL